VIGGGNTTDAVISAKGAILTGVRVGLTGGIASGKSTVSQILRELGAVVIDADALAREVVAKGTPGLAQVVAAFGEDLLGPDGELDRPKMGELVFERIVELEESAPEGAVVVHDIPLLAESGRAAASDRGGFDAVLVVDVPEADQVARGIARGMGESDVRDRMATQASREERRAIATHLLDNSGTVEDLRRQVAELYAELTA